MLSLNTHIKLEDVKKSKKLQEIMLDAKCNDKELEYYYNNGVKITLADIIDNAEMLFGDWFLKFKDERENSAWFICDKILGMCEKNKSIKEISEFIIKNIKEV